MFFGSASVANLIAANYDTRYANGKTNNYVLAGLLVAVSEQAHSIYRCG